MINAAQLWNLFIWNIILPNHPAALKIRFLKKWNSWAALLNSRFLSDLKNNMSKFFNKFQDEQCSPTKSFIHLKHPTPRLPSNCRAAAGQGHQAGTAGPRGLRRVPGECYWLGTKGRVALPRTSWPVHWSPAQDGKAGCMGVYLRVQGLGSKTKTRSILR